MVTDSFTKISRCIDANTSEAIQLMKNLVAIKAFGPKNNGEGEAEKAEFLHSYLAAIGFSDIQEFPAADPEVKGGIRPNLVARIPGKNRDKTVWIMSHMDVVPAGDLSKWKTPPFEAVVKDGRIYGRGTEDNNQGLVSSVVMARAFLEQKQIPEINIALLFVADEETGSTYGLDYLIENHRELFNDDDLFIVPDAGTADGSMIEVAEKSILWLKFKTTGEQVHASLPARGNNAFKAGSHLVVALDALHTTFNGKNDVFDPPISTFEPTRKESNVFNINTIPGEDIFFMDCRILPRYSLKDVMKEIKRISRDIEQKFNVTVEISIEQEDQAAPATSADAAVVNVLKKAIKQVYKIEAHPKGIGGGTVASIFRRAGLDVAVWSKIDDMAHQPNEYCVIENMINDAKVFAHVCLQNTL